MQTIALLTVSNIFTTIAWYGHPKHKDSHSGSRFLQVEGCLCRILFSGAGESNWTLPIHRSTIENHLRGYYLGGVLCVLGGLSVGGLSEGRVEMELSGWFCHDGGRRLRHLQRMVSHGSEKERVDESNRIGI
jgi:hypothetical protein